MDARFAQLLDNPNASPELTPFRLMLMRTQLHPPQSATPPALQSAWRFEVRPSDRVRPDATAQLIEFRGTAFLVSRTLRQPVAPEDRAALEALMRGRCSRPIAEIDGWSTRLSVVQRFLGAGLELEAVDTLSREMSHLELCRFPASRYAVARSYWENSVAVRKALHRWPDAVAAPDTFVRFLRELHVLYVMGPTLTTYHVPTSETRTMLLQSAQGPGQLRRAEVNCPVTLPFAMEYFKLLARSFGDRFATSDEVAHEDADGLSWGHTRPGTRLNGGVRQNIHLFCPPAVSPEHLQRLWQSARDATDRLHDSDRSALLASIAEFFRRFICLHPFVCGNMGLAMNIANWMLHQSLGGSICHLHIDWCAQRLEPPHFARLFERVVNRYLMRPDDPTVEPRILTQFDEVRRNLMALPSGPIAPAALLLE